MRIAILGAECTGKTQLAQELAAQLREDFPFVVCEAETSLLRAVYADVLRGDASLYAEAINAHRGVSLTLLTGMDFPLEGQRTVRNDPALRIRIDQRLRQVLVASGISFCTVYGNAPERRGQALQVIQRANGVVPTSTGTPWKWTCEKCSDAECEHRLFSALLGPSAA
jgi:HTH-type transcriptional repressor of NAD biosynthesis genes